MDQMTSNSRETNPAFHREAAERDYHLFSEFESVFRDLANSRAMYERQQARALGRFEEIISHHRRVTPEDITEALNMPFQRHHR